MPNQQLLNNNGFNFYLNQNFNNKMPNLNYFSNNWNIINNMNMMQINDNGSFYNNIFNNNIINNNMNINQNLNIPTFNKEFVTNNNNKNLKKITLSSRI